MNDATLQGFRDLAAVLATREKKQIALITDKGTVTAIFDPMFKTIQVGAMTVPESEISFWMKAAHSTTVKKIIYSK